MGNIYLIAGGNWDDFESTLKKIIADTGLQNTKVAYLGAANDNNARFFQSTKSALLAAGSCEVVKLDFKHAEKALNAIEQCSVIFVSGGDVEKGIKILTEQGAVTILEKAFNHGTHFIGVSAGAIMLCEKWVAWQDGDEGNPYLFDCLGFAEIYCDAHDEPKWQELKELLKLLKDKKAKGIGLRSGSAIKVIGRSYELLAGKVDVI